jgi:predicted nucleotidyltransferase
MILPLDFKEFLQLLNSHKVEYLLIGGYVVGYYGYPRATADMDVWVNANPENAKKLVEVLKEFGFGEVEAELFLREEQIIRMGTPPLRIELLTSISGVSFGDCYERRTNAEIDGVEVKLISLEDLKKNKKASGRYKDLDDLQQLP